MSKNRLLEAMNSNKMFIINGELTTLEPYYFDEDGDLKIYEAIPIAGDDLPQIDIDDIQEMADSVGLDFVTEMRGEDTDVAIDKINDILKDLFGNLYKQGDLLEYSEAELHELMEEYYGHEHGCVFSHCSD